MEKATPKIAMEVQFLHSDIKSWESLNLYIQNGFMFQ